MGEEANHRPEAKSVDFVLAWTDDLDRKNAAAAEKRRVFEKNLATEGLELRVQHLDKFHFVLIHAPFEVLERYCEILKLKMPIKVVETEVKEEHSFDIVDEVKSWFKYVLKFIDFDKSVFPVMENKLTAEFSRGKDYL